MFGFFLGTICLIALISVLRRRWWGGCGWHGPAYGRYGSYGRYPQRWRGGRRNWRWGMLRSIFERLDTTPGQEKAILAAASDLREPSERARSEIRESLTEVAQALREDRIDEAKLRQAFSRQRDALGTAQEALLGALSRVHEALNPNQRRELAEWIQSRSHFYRHCDGDAIAA